MNKKYVVLFDVFSGQYFHIYDNEKEMLSAIQAQDIKDIKVFEIAREIKLTKRPAIIIEQKEANK